MSTTFERLPLDVSPISYRLHLLPDLVACTFTGSVAIDVEVKEKVSSFVLHSASLDIVSCSFQYEDATKKDIIIPSFSLDAEVETILVTFKEKVKKGKGTLHFTFQGTLNDSMKGFYRTKYSVEGKDRFAAVTQFEATDARRAFPCWDEPSFKATFDVKITAASNRVVLSNMPEIDVEIEGDHKCVTFASTPIMSTYLLAFVVGEFDYIEDTTSDGRISVRVFVPLGKKEQGQFALDMAVKVLPFYEEWFGIEYPLPKADLIAIPDFAAGAMENWGLVTYRETALLVDPSSSSASTKQWVALVVAHELAHQWFGNLVTMEWWTHLWLNEGFASWMEYLATDYSFPEWKMWKQFVYQDMGCAFSLDALKSSHPIEVPVSHPDEIDEIFDTISYSKGCTVIRMLYSFLGEKSFKEGLHQYLRKHQYSNAFTEDLWEALENASQKPVKEMMDTWTKQMGFPVITVSREGNHQLKLHQTRFLSDMSSATPEDKDMTWFVPISIIHGDNQEEPSFELLKERQSIISAPPLSCGSWLKLNANQCGFYRVYYASEDLRNNLAHSIQSGDLRSVTDRLGVQSDALALSRAGIMPTIEALELMNAFGNESDYTVWADLTSNLNSICNLVASPGDSPGDGFRRNLYKNISASVGWDEKEGESVLMSQLRSLVLRQVGMAGHVETINEAQKRFALYVKDPTSLSVNLRSCVYGIVIRYGGVEAYESILSIMRGTDFQEEKERCMRALGITPDEELLQRTLEFALSDEVRPQDAVSVIGSVARNSRGTELAWNFLQTNWLRFKEMYKSGSLLNSLIKIVGNFKEDKKITEIKQFFATNSHSSRSLDQSIETITTKAAWHARDGEAIKTWFQRFN